jgi:hypothetical protein
MEIKGMVLDLEVVFLAQLVDPSLADVAPGSDKVAPHVEDGSHRVGSFRKLRSK